MSRSICLGLLLLGIGCAIPATLEAQAIPADRLAAWEGNVGVQGGIPSRTLLRDCVVEDGAHADGLDSAPQIQACLDNTPSNGIAFLAPGSYRLGAHLTLTGSKTLRGSGPGVTILLADDLDEIIQIGGGYWVRATVDVLSGHTRGSTSLTLADASAIDVGAYVRVDELNDPSIPVTNVGYGTCTWCGREDGARVRGQLVQVTAKTGNTVTIAPPLFFTLSASLSPQVQAFSPAASGGATAQHSGVEDLTIKNDWQPSRVRGTDGREYGAIRSHTSSSDGSDRPTTGSAWQSNWAETAQDGSLAPDWQPSTAYDGDYDNERVPVDASATANCWLRNVVIDTCGARCVQLAYNNFRFELRDSHLVGCINRWDSNNCYGTLIGAYTTGTLIENNVYESLADGPMFAWSASGNVVAYNYIYDAHRLMNQRTWFTGMGGSHHGAHTSFNLWEGNELESMYFDQYWGSHSHNTAFRNRVLGKYMVDGIAQEASLQNVHAIATERHVRYQTYVGNVLGSPGYQDTYERNSEACPNGFLDRLVYRTGYASSGNCTPAEADPQVFTTMLRHQNFDYQTGTTHTCSDVGEPGCQGGDGSADLPASLYLPSKPVWFGDIPWPPVDPAGPSLADIPAKRRFWAASLPQLEITDVIHAEGDGATTETTFAVTLTPASTPAP